MNTTWIVTNKNELINAGDVSRICVESTETANEKQPWKIIAELRQSHRYNYVTIGKAATEKEARKIMYDALLGCEIINLFSKSNA